VIPQRDDVNFIGAQDLCGGDPPITADFMRLLLMLATARFYLIRPGTSTLTSSMSYKKDLVSMSCISHQLAPG
jgi:hypothetical protein